MIDFQRLADAVEQQRSERGLTLKEVAGEAGVDPTKLSTLRRGRALSVDNLLLLCLWLGVPVESFRADGAPEWVERVLEGYGRLDARATQQQMAETSRLAERQADLVID